MTRQIIYILAIIPTLIITGCSSVPIDEEVNLYTARKEHLIRPLVDIFEKDTGIRVNIVSAKTKVLIKKIIDEGETSPADLLITVDAGNLHKAKLKNISQKIESEKLNSLVPDYLRDNEGHWYGLSIRSRVIMYNPEKINPKDLMDYEYLMNPALKGRVCIRSSSNIYNQSLLASLIHHNGQKAALEWAKGVVDNFSRPPKGNDRGQMTAVVLGKCDVTLANTYYLGKWISSKKDTERAYAKKIKVLFPNQDNRGAHINISGGFVTKNAKNKDNAIKLIEFLAGDEAQEVYAKQNHEYPIRQNINISDTVKSWGYPFKMDSMNLTNLGELNDDAGKVFDIAKWK
jgi:iron(III) transport system substrate-binding protein